LAGLVALAACTTPPGPSKVPEPAPRLQVARTDLELAIAGDLASLGGSIEPVRAQVWVHVDESAGLLFRAGLRDGDEVLSVGGLPLTLSNALVLRDRLRSAPDTRITVRRHGERLSWRVALAD
jgi:hypothetical protein